MTFNIVASVVACFTKKTELFLFFNDGVRRVDYVIVYENHSPCDTTDGMQKKNDNEIWRKKFFDGLKKRGIETEEMSGQYRLHASYTFVKVHVPWEPLTDIAESIALQKPLAPDEIRILENVKTWSSWFRLDTEVRGNDKPRTGQDEKEEKDEKTNKVVMSPFSCARQDQFNIVDKDTFFSPAQRSMMAHYILSRTVFDNGSKTGNPKFGIDELISLGAVSAAYPLHSKEVESVFDFKKLALGPWRYLFQKDFKDEMQLDHVRHYYGEKIGFFFCWMFFYTNMLAPLILVGIICFISGLVKIHTLKYISDMCDESKNTSQYSMCPVGCLDFCHEECNNTYPLLIDSCDLAKVCALFDNDAIILNVIVTTLWTFVFMKLWKRRASVLQITWHVRDYKSEESLRPQLYTFTAEKRKHPITDELEPYISLKTKCVRRGGSLLAVILMILANIGIVIGLMELGEVIECLVGFQGSTSIISLLSLLVVVMFAKMYTWFSTVLTDYEMHRTESEWENSFRLKYFLFCFINNNAGPLIMIIVAPNLTSESSITGDGPKISLLLVIYMVGEPTVLFLVEMIQEGIKSSVKEGLKTLNDVKTFPPGIKSSRNIGIKTKGTEQENIIPGGEKDFQLEDVPTHILTELYSDLVIQYGFIVMYAAVFPVAAILAAIRNVLNSFHIANQFSKKWRRPIAGRAQDVGIYYVIVRFISFLALIINGYLIATSTHFIPKWVRRETYDDGRTYVDFRLIQHERYISREETVSCYADFKMTIGGGDLSKDYYKTYSKGLTFAIFFAIGTFIFAVLIDLVPDIPMEEYIDLSRQNYLAQKVLRQYLMKGQVTKDKLDDRAPKDKGLVGIFHVGSPKSEISESESDLSSFDSYDSILSSRLSKASISSTIANLTSTELPKEHNRQRSEKKEEYKEHS